MVEIRPNAGCCNAQAFGPQAAWDHENAGISPTMITDELERVYGEVGLSCAAGICGAQYLEMQSTMFH